MILINLLPHREIANKRRKEVFQMAMFGALLAGLLAAAVVFSIYQALIGSQQERNSYLKSEISQLDNQIKDNLIINNYNINNSNDLKAITTSYIQTEKKS